MRTSTEGLMALIGHEGVVLSRYRDSVGVWTIGVGHTKAAGGLNPDTFTGKLTVGQVLNLLREDIAKYEAGVNNAVKVPLKQHEFDALVSFHFNTGAIAKATLTKSLNAGDRQLAAKQFMNWVKPKEITARRMAERDLFLTGRYPKPTATIYPATPGGVVQWGMGKRVDLRDLLGSSALPPIPSEPGVVVMPPDNTKQPVKNRLLAWLIDRFLAIFWRKN